MNKNNLFASINIFNVVYALKYFYLSLCLFISHGQRWIPYHDGAKIQVRG